MPKHLLNTILSMRDYRQGGEWLVAVQALPGAPHELAALEHALREPRFVLYLGRKSCPPAAPLAPRVVDADSAHAAISAWLRSAGRQATLRSLAWGDRAEAGVSAHFSVPRKDRLIRRKGWLFGDRTEHVALLIEGE